MVMAGAQETANQLQALGAEERATLVGPQVAPLSSTAENFVENQREIRRSAAKWHKKELMLCTRAERNPSPHHQHAVKQSRSLCPTTARNIHPAAEGRVVMNWYNAISLQLMTIVTIEILNPQCPRRGNLCLLPTKRKKLQRRRKL